MVDLSGKITIIAMFSSVYGVMNPRFEIYDGIPMTKEIEYSVVKAGLIHMTSYLARCSRGSGIRGNCVSPGGVFNHQHSDFCNATTPSATG